MEAPEKIGRFWQRSKEIAASHKKANGHYRLKGDGYDLLCAVGVMMMAISEIEQMDWCHCGSDVMDCYPAKERLEDYGVIEEVSETATKINDETEATLEQIVEMVEGLAKCGSTTS